jgi:hypothetical protein
MHDVAESNRITIAHHVKRGTEYYVMPIEANLQCSGRIKEGTMLTLYLDTQDATKFWARPTYEFKDGRFTITEPPHDD